MVVVLTYTTINLLRKCEKQEDSVEHYREFYEKVVLKGLSDLVKRVNEIDSRQIFAEDDDVGSIYKGISSALKDTAALMGINPESNGSKEEKGKTS